MACWVHSGFAEDVAFVCIVKDRRMASQDGAMFSMQQLWDEGAKAFEDFLIFLDNKLYNKRPSGVLLLTVVGTILFSIVLDVLLKMWRELSIAGQAVGSAFFFIVNLMRFRKIYPEIPTIIVC